MDNVITSIYQTITKKFGIIPKSWQVSVMINMIHNKKDIVISTGIGSGKSLFYQLIFFIKDGAIVLIVLPTIALIIDQVHSHLLL